MEAKQVIVILKVAGMPRGKEIAQGAHASMAWLTSRLARRRWWRPWLSLSRAERAWLRGSFTKVVCQVSTLEELRQVRDAAAQAGLTWHVITDAGRTVFHGQPTVTALAIGPDWAERINPVTSGLKLY